jgi:methylamine dehydrogenase accessory protein MauD
MEGWWAASYVVLWVLAIMLSVLVVALARQIGTLHLRLGPRGALEMDDEGPPLGAELQPVVGTDLSGREVSLGGPGEPQLLLFVSPGCRVCEQVLPGLPAVAGKSKLAPYLVTDLDRAETAHRFAAPKLGVPIVPGAAAVEAYGVPGTPYALVVDALGIVRGKGTINNLEQMEGLVDSAIRRVDAAPREVHAV